jgi:DNA-binding NarL/FixJ family response regulator
VRAIPRGPQAATRNNPAGLTARELQVLELLTEGLQNSEIAGRLHLSVKTVGHHVAAILRKLGVSSRNAAAMAAVDQQLFGKIGNAAL